MAAREDEDALPAVEFNGQVGLNLLSGIVAVVSVIIASGTNIPPKDVGTYTESVGMSLGFWADCIILALLGSLCYCEMGAMIPKFDAECSCLSKTFGPQAALFYSWMLAWIVRPYLLKMVALAFAHYVMVSFFPDWEISPIPVKKIIGAICLALTMFINCVSIKWALCFQNLFTYGKVITLLILMVVGLVAVGSGNLQSLKVSFDETTSNFANTGLAFYLGLCAYDGWRSFNFFSEKMKNLARDLTRAPMIGTSLVIFVFLLTNIAYHSVIGGHDIFNSGAAAMVVAWLIPIFVTCSTFGCMNGLAFNGAWLVFLLDHNDHMPKVRAMVHKTFHTPVASIIFLHVIALIMLITGSSEFSIFFNFFNFAAWISYFAVITALMYLRWKHPDANRPYKVWLIVPIIANLAVLYLLITSFWQEPKESAMARLSVLPGIPLYFICSRDAWDGCCASGLSHLLSELLRYVVEEFKYNYENRSNVELVCFKAGFAMMRAVSPEEEESSNRFLGILYDLHSFAVKREDHLLAQCRQFLDLSYLFDVEGWSKTDQHIVQERRAKGLMAAIHQNSFQA